MVTSDHLQAQVPLLAIIIRHGNLPIISIRLLCLRVGHYDQSLRNGGPCGWAGLCTQMLTSQATQVQRVPL